MQEIKTTLAELDAMHDAYNDDFMMYLAGSYLAIRAYIEKLEREAEAGRVLAEAVEKMYGMHPDGCAKLICKTGEDCHACQKAYEARHWYKQRNAALTAYHSVTRDITSKE